MASLRDLVVAEAQRQGVDPSYVLPMVQQESSWNPRATSNKGAQGLMQLMPGTARDMGVIDPYNVEQNVRGGVKYFKQQLDKYKRPDLAYAAYNAGPGNVDKYGGVPPFKETQDYVSKLTRGAETEAIFKDDAPDVSDIFADDDAGQPPQAADVSDLFADEEQAPAQPSIYALHPKSYRDEHAEQLRAIQVDQEGKHAETGRTVKYKQSAIDAFDDLDTRITFANRLMECLKS